MTIYSNKNHYTYELIYSDGRRYLGVRSCECDIHEDNYYGSSKYTPNEIPNKCILSTHACRTAAVFQEVLMHKAVDAKANPLYYNKANQTCTKFDTSGTNISKEHKRKISKALKGTKNPNKESLLKFHKENPGVVSLRIKKRWDSMDPKEKAAFHEKMMTVNADTKKRKKAGKSIKSLWSDPEWKEKMMEGRAKGKPGGKPPKSVTINSIVYGSLTEAHKHTGISLYHLRKLYNETN